MAQVSLRNVSKIFPPDVVAVRDISLEAENREFLVLVGPSGCGKSTTLRMVAGLEKASTGEIYISDKIVNDVQEKLLTIFGLRTLSIDDPKYKGRYIGNYNKDTAYHNGTVWPWLLGPFIKAYIKVRKNDPASRKFAYNSFIKPMLEVFDEKWDGSIYEIFDGDPIYAPRGCISQAWSIAEILRAWVEDIEKISPPYEKIFELPEISV